MALIRVGAMDLLRHRHGLACEQALIGHHITRFDQARIGGHALAFINDQNIAAHDLMACDALTLTITNDKRFRA